MVDGPSSPSRWRALALISLGVNILVVGAVLWIWHEEIEALLERTEPVETRPPAEEARAVERPDRMVLVPASHDDLPGWSEEPFVSAVGALERSCAVWKRRPGDHPVGRDGVGGRVADWRGLCTTLVDAVEDPEALRALLERETRVWQVRNREDESGLFTGYYEPSLRGRKRRSDGFRVPLHVRPRDLVTVDLGSFRKDLAGRRIAGRLRGDELIPYPDREAIAGGALAGRGLELVWVDDPVDAFFLQIQGSGRVLLDDGREMRVGYAGQNGHPYYAIGKELIEREHLSREEVSLQSIRRWLAENPDQAAEIMNTNASYVFFRQLEGEGPLGSMGVALTPERSLAVDMRFLPPGAPVWLDTVLPAVDEDRVEAPFRRLMVAQDTGGAIRGPVRGDVFWGYGERAETIAGHMKSEGRLWLLLPASVEPPRELGPPGGSAG